MRVFITLLLSILVFLINSIAYAGNNYGAKICASDPAYHCYKVKRKDSWDRLFPDETERDLVKRVNRMNTRLHTGMRIALPNDLKVNPLQLSPMSQQISPPGRKIIMVSLSKLAFGAYDADGKLVYWGPVSGGQNYCRDIHRRCMTPTGHFAIYSKEGRYCVSTKFPVGRGGAPMPYCMYFHGGMALHGSYEVPGYNASHGCVRMFVNDAQWLNQEFTAGESGVPVLVSY